MRHRLTALSCLGVSCALTAQDPPPAATPTTTFVVPGVRKLTIGGQYRLRYEAQIDLDLDSSAGVDTNDFFTQRARLDLGFDFSDRLAMFLQFQDAREFGEETSTLDDTADGLDVHQARVDLKAVPGIGGELRLGRQELSLGDQRLVGALDWKTQARSFDGLLHTHQGDDFALRTWAFQTREVLSPATANDDQWFFGSQASRTFDAELAADLYLMLLHDDGLTAGTTANRFTFGTRWAWQPAPWDAGLELATQFGDQAGNDIPIAETWAGHVHLARRFDCDCKPWARAELNVASGDDPGTTDVERFNNLFPTAHMHWGMMDVALWENLFNPMLQFGFEVCEQSTLSLSWNWFRAMEGRDSFGGPNGTLVPSGATDSRTIGNEFDVVFTRPLDLGTSARTAVQVGYGLFLPGAAPESIGRDSTGHFVYAQFDLRF